MPDLPRNADYLYLYQNVSRRVSNLETGVHPVRSESGYGDTYNPTLVTVTSSLLVPAFQGVTDLRWRWQRAMGIVSMVGAVELTTHTHGDLPASEIVGTLPSPARPQQPLRLRGSLTVAPWSFTFTVGTDGVVTITKPDGPAAGTKYQMYFEGSSWTVN
jgi:hypothetical protein